MFTGRVIPRAFLNTLIISSGSTVLATILGVSLAWINARTNCPLRDYLEPYNLVPFFLSPFVGAIAWHNLGEPKTGLLNVWARDWFGVEGHLFNVDNIYGVIWVTGLFFAPLIYLFVVGSLRRMDPSLEDSARTTGAGLFRTTVTVTLPLVMPGILSGAIIVFVTSAGEFGVPFKLSAPYGWETLTTQIFSKAVGDDANHYLGAAHEHGVRRHHGLFDLDSTTLYRAAFVHDRDWQGLSTQRARPWSVEMARIWLQSAVHSVARCAAEFLPDRCQSPSGVGRANYSGRNDLHQLREDPGLLADGQH